MGSSCHRLQLRAHPLLPKPWEPDDALQRAFENQGWDPAGSCRGPDDLSPYDVLRQLRRVEIRLHRVALKHFAVRRVRADIVALFRRRGKLAAANAELSRPAE